MQQGFSWDRDVNLPIAGKSPRQRHASATGAHQAARTRGALALAYLNLLAIAGPRGMSDYESADALGRLVSSICSTRNGLGDLVIESGSFEETAWHTKRTRYVLAPEVLT
jgi:hypothetical protein